MAKKSNTQEDGSEEIVTIVVVVTSPLAEDGNVYIAGETFETTPERAAALGDLVKPVE